MSGVTEIRNALAELPSNERAEVAAYILGGLPSPYHDVSDEEVYRRSEELDSGKVKALTHQEFLDACGRS